jgi:hypothetical protein
MERQSDRVQEFSVSGDQLLAKFKELVHEGNIRRITIKNEEGKTLIEVPLTIGLVGVALLPVFAAIGAVAALATRCTIVVERTEDGASSQTDAATGQSSSGSDVPGSGPSDSPT